jgi:regulatory protein
LKSNATIEQTALRLLARREHSRKELARKLLQRGFAEIDIEPILDKLIASRALSDLRFAQSYVYARLNKGFGPVRIAHELRERGVDEDIAKQALMEYQDEFPIMAQRVYKKYRAKERLYQFMIYRGFLPVHFDEKLNEYSAN